MPLLTVEDTDKMIEEMCHLAYSNSDLQLTLHSLDNWKSRWVVLEEFIIKHLDGIGLDEGGYHFLWIRERIFYEMQQKTETDYGFCKHFIPAFRNRTESLLTDDLKIDLFNKCSYSGEVMDSTCCGTERNICVHLHPELSINPATRIKKAGYLLN